MFLSVDEGANLSELIVPVLPAIIAFLGVTLVGVIGIHNRRRGAVETKAPDVNDIWAQERLIYRSLEFERRARWALEDAYRKLRRAFQNYVDRQHTGGSKELTARERAALDHQFQPETGEGPTQG